MKGLNSMDERCKLQFNPICSVIRQKDEPQSRCNKKAKHAKFSENMHLLPPDTHTCVCVRLFEKLDLLCFLETPVSRFALF